MATSFMCEHTVEYYLVARIVAASSGVFKKVSPFFFWKTREGNSMSSCSASRDKMYFFAVYPRRPKVSHPGARSIEMKFNSTLFDVAHSGSVAGVPVMAGIPLVTSITDLEADVKCSWFYLHGHSGLSGDVIIDLDLLGQPSSLPSGIEHLVSTKAALRLAKSKSTPMVWEEFYDFVSGLNFQGSAGSFYSRFFAMGGYKPFYVMAS